MKLSQDNVDAIRRRCAKGEMQLTIAREFGVNPSTISDIVLWKTHRVSR